MIRRDCIVLLPKAVSDRHMNREVCASAVADVPLARQNLRPESPRHRSVLVGKSTRWAVGTDQSHFYCLRGTLLDRAVASEVVQIRSDKTGAYHVHFNVGLFQLDGKRKRGGAESGFGGAVSSTKDTAVGGLRVGV